MVSSDENETGSVSNAESKTTNLRFNKLEGMKDLKNRGIEVWGP